MNDSAIVEAGTHGELLEHEGSDYGRLWHASAGVRSRNSAHRRTSVGTRRTSRRLRVRVQARGREILIRVTQQQNINLILATYENGNYLYKL